MKKYPLIGLGVLYIIGMSACNSHKNDMPAHSHEHHSHHSHKGHEHHDHDHDHDHADHSDEGEEDKETSEITLSPDKAKELGVKTTHIEKSPFSEVIKVVGFCNASTNDFSLASAPSSGIITLMPDISVGKAVYKGQVIARISGEGMAGGDANANARIALETAKKELDRLTPLHADGIVSTRDYNSALAEYEKAKAAVGSSKTGSQVTARTTGVITELFVYDGAFVEQGASIASITSNDRLTIKADVPVRFSGSVNRIADCNLVFAGKDSVYTLQSLNGKQISGSVGRVANGYMPVYFEITSDGNILSGMPVELYLKGANKESVITVPLTALSEQQGIYYVYEQLDEDCYKKIPVKTGNNDGVNVEILSGINEGMNIVTEGTLFVKLAESSGAVPEGHSHSH
ncbi:MAG: efflux RND transporter periplasmic adaptor subunit [Bacteroidales bacterium]|nr:efflux RND transporter periplasmic adaptor subunit [Bacteroidales bacterium]